MAININATRDISSGEVLLSSTPGIDLATAPAEPTLFTVPPGQTIVVTKAVVRVTAASGVGGAAAVAGIGTDVNEGNMLPARSLIGLTVVDDDYLIFTETKQVVANGGQAVKFGIDSAIGAGSMTVTVDLFGYVVGSTTLDSQTTGLKAHVERTTDTAIVTANWSPVVWEAEIRDDNGFVDLGTNNDRITATVAGDFLLVLRVGWADNGTGSRLVRVNRYNSSDVLQEQQRMDRAPFPSALGGGGWHETALFLDSAIGDYFTMEVFQDSGGNLNLLDASIRMAKV